MMVPNLFEIYAHISFMYYPRIIMIADTLQYFI
uniref:Uncharacterized protein n=1 Tax=Anguilla anguilla TaxID=7936 RepID=A0A0E9R9Z7_ANGAN